MDIICRQTTLCYQDGQERRQGCSEENKLRSISKIKRKENNSIHRLYRKKTAQLCTIILKGLWLPSWKIYYLIRNKRNPFLAIHHIKMWIKQNYKLKKEHKTVTNRGLNQNQTSVSSIPNIITGTFAIFRLHIGKSNVLLKVTPYKHNLENNNVPLKTRTKNSGHSQKFIWKRHPKTKLLVHTVLLVIKILSLLKISLFAFGSKKMLAESFLWLVYVSFEVQFLFLSYLK